MENFKNTIVEYSAGNPGAMSFLMKTFADPEADLVNALIVDNKLKKCPSIRGTNLYVLWSDLCNQDITKVVQVCENVPDEILEEACNRQDYSGRELIQEFIVSVKE